MNQLLTNTLRSGRDKRGRFGEFGGRFVTETLMPATLGICLVNKNAEYPTILQSAPAIAR